MMVRLLVLGSTCLLTACQISTGQQVSRPDSQTGAAPLAFGVASSSGIASDVGVAILAAGGNAVDAAVAVHMALAVVHPTAGNLGGGGFLLHWDAASADVSALDFREMAPAAASREMYTADGVAEDASWRGWLAVGVPGSVAGMWDAHQRWGRLPWADLLQPAIRLASQGSPIATFTAKEADTYAEVLANDPAGRLLVNEAGTAGLPPGTMIRQPELAEALNRIANDGRDAFYQGMIATMMALSSTAGGGILTVDDLANYETKWREPLRFSYRDVEVFSMPPPSSGGIVIGQVLAMREHLNAHQESEADAIHRLAEMLRISFADRAFYLGDADFAPVPLESLLDEARLHDLADGISIRSAGGSRSFTPNSAWLESDDTTHYTIIDAEGNVVSCTTTLNGSFGAKVSVPGFGFWLNNEMDDFTTSPGEPNFFGLIQSDLNAIEPGKRMLSSMTPTLVLKDGQPRLALGSPGGPRIITAVLQTLLNVVDADMPVADAVRAPRLHHQWLPDELELEGALHESYADDLRARGHTIEEVSRRTEVAAIERVGDAVRGAVDDRYDGCFSQDGNPCLEGGWESALGSAY